MACFLVPTTEAIVTTIVKKSADKSVAVTNSIAKRPLELEAQTK